MIEHRKRKPSKRELIETDGYSKHSKAQPYVRRDPMEDMDDEEKQIYLQALVGEWDANGV